MWVCPGPCLKLNYACTMICVYLAWDLSRLSQRVLAQIDAMLISLWSKWIWVSWKPTLSSRFKNESEELYHWYDNNHDDNDDDSNNGLLVGWARVEPTLCIKFYKINTVDTISAAKGSSGNYECVFLCVKGCLVQPLITICKNLFTWIFNRFMYKVSCRGYCL